MPIKLWIHTARDVEGQPQLFHMTSTSEATEKSFGLGAGTRVFDFVDNLVAALEPANLGEDTLRHVARELERGKPLQLELTDEQAAAIGMLPVPRNS
jgi:hypothetical protein